MSTSNRATEWAVVDVETTGLHPARDRIVEIAIIRLDAEANPVDEWTTVVDPGMLVRDSRIHGLQAADLQGAPSFREILPDVLARFSDRVIVAHNAPFDVSFLQAETVRAGVAWGPADGLCTMALTHDLGLAKSRKLPLCCEEMGLPIGQLHSAVDDARAVVGLFQRVLPRLWTVELPSTAPQWPAPGTSGRIQARPETNRPPAPAATDHLARVRPPDVGVPAPAVSTYLGLLDLVVEDRVVTQNEIDALELFAHSCGITRDKARQLHQAYLAEMWAAARDDDVVTEAERADLDALTVALTAALPH